MSATDSLRHAAGVLRAGGIVAYATEAVFGLGCDPRNRRAVDRLRRIKQRNVRKGFILIAAKPEQLASYVSFFPPCVLASWPGPHTWLLPARSGKATWVTGRSAAIAVRVTAHPQAAALCRACGTAIVSTSANRAGQHPARNRREVLRRFGRLVDYVLPGRVGGLGRPTPITDAASGRRVRSG
ncbi:MAG: L-threonylcarbamoyladenylate synthase [Acidiferrobacterales bacterium]